MLRISPHPNYSIPPFKLSKSKYIISIRSPILWKNIPTNSDKMQGAKSFWNLKMKYCISSQIAQKAGTRLAAPQMC